MLFLILDMIDQTDRGLAAIDGDAAHHIVAVLPVLDVEERVAIYYLEVLTSRPSMALIVPTTWSWVSATVWVLA